MTGPIPEPPTSPPEPSQSQQAHLDCLDMMQRAAQDIERGLYDMPDESNLDAGYKMGIQESASGMLRMIELWRQTI